MLTYTGDATSEDISFVGNYHNDFSFAKGDHILVKERSEDIRHSTPHSLAAFTNALIHSAKEFSQDYGFVFETQRGDKVLFLGEECDSHGLKWLSVHHPRLGKGWLPEIIFLANYNQ